MIHIIDNLFSHVPIKPQEQIKPEVRALFYQKDRHTANQAVAAFIEKYQKVYSIAIERVQFGLEACLTFYAFPLEDDSDQQCHGATLWGSQALFA